jgi:hypothetical protein
MATYVAKYCFCAGGLAQLSGNRPSPAVPPKLWPICSYRPTSGVSCYRRLQTEWLAYEWLAARFSLHEGWILPARNSRQSQFG